MLSFFFFSLNNQVVKFGGIAGHIYSANIFFVLLNDACRQVNVEPFLGVLAIINNVYIVF